MDPVMSICAHFKSGSQELRPILTSLNGDNSWRYSFPRPAYEREKSGKQFFHLVHDPWLNGPTFTTGVGVEELVHEIETTVAAATNTSYHNATAVGSPVDAILINLDEVDHLHEPTLRTFDASHPGPPLPSWLTIFRMPTPTWLTFTTALVLPDPQKPSSHETILYIPHGVPVDNPSIQTFLHPSTLRVTTLAMLHGLKEASLLGWKSTFGVGYGLKLYQEAKPKYWVPTHNSALRYSGVLSYAAWDTTRTLEWGIENQEDGGKGGILPLRSHPAIKRN
ncbi:hypothetical protein BU23DRAFT_585556 [Bimuria novae-zelandiae CBS 107.79]|uniref:Uncharacterized protein n=1 Tax=Bimuria novae-zelandiae CBS 107.79 TaxID=1447943 RepID=A0A6A5UNJ5_9PLEO|nr:hypothetical protein BU23DRAFT_585556 [Bimuria novae-zelandiae CBS 107.79]